MKDSHSDQAEWVEEHLQVIRTLMERVMVYRRAWSVSLWARWGWQGLWSGSGAVGRRGGRSCGSGW